MAALTFHQRLDTLALPSDFLLMSEGTAPADATSASGWTVAKIAAGNWSTLEALTEQPGTFDATRKPNLSPTQSSGTDGFRSAQKLTGTFAAGDWTLSFSVVSVGAASGQDGRVNFKLWKLIESPPGTPFHFTPIFGTFESRQTGIATDVSTTPQTITATFNPGQFAMEDEFLLVQLAWEITGASGSNSADVLLRVGTDCNLVTADFTPSGFDKRVEREASETFLVDGGAMAA